MTTATNLNAKRRRSPASIATGIVVVLGLALVGASGLYTDSLWFGQLGYQEVFTTQILAQAGVFAAAALFFGLITWLGFFIAYKNRPIYLKFADEGDPFAQYRALLDQLRKVVSVGLPILLGIFAGVAAASRWPIVMMWLNRTYTGEVDAQFGLDVSFYMFDLPFLQALTSFVSAAVLLAGIIAAAVHIIYGNIRFRGRETKVGKSARVQLSVTAALYLLVQGASLWLDQYSTMTSSSGLYTGATYTDVNATIPGFQILALISLVVAILFLITAVMGKWRLPIMGTALMIISSMVLGALYPWIVQTFQVGPNERTIEAQYIERNIEATRAAYGLDAVEAVEYDAETTATSGALREDAETTANIRIIDPALVSASFKQLEQYKQYYSFESHLDVDRYTIDGKTQDTVIAVRELDQAGLGDSQSWYNNVIVYTHGYGVVAAYGNQRSAEGQPVFLQKGIPSNGLLGEYEPRIYFGESSPVYSIVGGPANTEPRELDYPAGDGEADQTYTTFTGDGGPKLDNIFARLAYALKFQSEQILLSDALNNESQILYDRDPRTRVSEVAPYLTLDSDSYPAVVDGRVVWIVDGYTTSANYPYSRAENFGDAITDSNSGTISTRGSINYIRNSVKATVDAYDGSVTLYAWDETDPILKTWSKIFPNTIKPVSEMSGDLMSHVRYPADLFKMQRAVLGSYHVTDAGAFYSQEDAWMTPNDPVSGSDSNQVLQPPYYLTLQVPGATAPSFSLYSTFIPRSTGESSRNVLKGYFVVDSDAGSTDGKVSSNYGKLRLLTLPASTIVPGPGQVQNAFSADSEVSRLLNILRQGSTQVLNGNLLTLPVGGGLLYVQPVYIKSTGETSFPLLKKVLVAFGDKIAFEDTLDEALDSLFGGNSGAEAGDGDGVTVPEEPGVEEPTTGEGTNAALAAALEKARKAMLDREAAMAAGDWAAYGKADDALKAAIEAAIAASN
ncbi:UPF0182 family protein [Rhodoluna sp. KAS3]|uniref:UPF0182 family membrane protein n=1 Tax=Rhodoluna sp. KAS3 TaxID=942880 RepID=UPI00222E6662|nr:UPF0182 family protein [Rhodoluna sp. KAS3]BDS48776.1 UPF0182 protein [Rhodoluna sp. KAS3]